MATDFAGSHMRLSPHSNCPMDLISRQIVTSIRMFLISSHALLGLLRTRNWNASLVCPLNLETHVDAAHVVDYDELQHACVIVPEEEHVLEKGGDQTLSGSHALEAEQIFSIPSLLAEPAIPLVAETARKDDVVVLNNFMKTLEGGLAKYDSASTTTTTTFHFSSLQTATVRQSWT